MSTVFGDGGLDPVERCFGVNPVGASVAGTDRVGDERVDGEYHVAVTEKIRATGVTEAGAALVAVQRDQLIAEHRTARDQGSGSVESGARVALCLLAVRVTRP